MDLDLARERFESSTDFTIGLEEEFAILDPETLELAHRFEDVYAACQEDELLASMRQALEQRARRLGASVERDRADRDARLPRSHRVLFVGGDPGWRATLAVVLSRATSVETSPMSSEIRAP